MVNLETLAPITSLLGLGIGVPNQIYRLYKEKTANEISLLNWSIGVISCAVWALYAKSLHNYFLMKVNFMGLILSLIVIAQIIYYRHLKLKI